MADTRGPTVHGEEERLARAAIRLGGRRRSPTASGEPLDEEKPLASRSEMVSGPTRYRRHVYRLRPAWRPRYSPDVFVPADLQLLAGPTRGTFDPPVNLFWQPGELDFGRREDLVRFYSSALRRIVDAEGFSKWINGAALIELWALLGIPSAVRSAWETVHPELREEGIDVNARLRVQDTVLAAVGGLGFALAGGSALLDYDVVTRETEDIDAFLDRLDAGAFAAGAAAVLEACHANGWSAELVFDEDLDKQIRVEVGGDSVVVQLVYHQRSGDPERREGGGLRLIFPDVVGGKAVALADSPRGRDFDDIARIVDTAGWSLERVEAAMVDLGYQDMVSRFRSNIKRFRGGEFDSALRAEGFDPDFSHSILDEVKLGG